MHHAWRLYDGIVAQTAGFAYDLRDDDVDVPIAVEADGGYIVERKTGKRLSPKVQS